MLLLRTQLSKRFVVHKIFLKFMDHAIPNLAFFGRKSNNYNLSIEGVRFSVYLIQECRSADSDNRGTTKV